MASTANSYTASAVSLVSGHRRRREVPDNVGRRARRTVTASPLVSEARQGHGAPEMKIFPLPRCSIVSFNTLSLMTSDYKVCLIRKLYCQCLKGKNLASTKNF